MVERLSRGRTGGEGRGGRRSRAVNNTTRGVGSQEIKEGGSGKQAANGIALIAGMPIDD
jgi:hypothetical protein